MEKMVCNLISQNVIAIFGPSNAGGTAIVASICNTLDIPHIVYDWSPGEALADREHSAMTLNLHPDNLQLSRGFAEIVQSFGWRSYTILYETDKELQQLQDVLQINEPSGNPTTIRQLDPFDPRPQLKTIKLSTDNCLILHCAADKVLGILRDANDLKMLGEYQSVFIPALDAHTLEFAELLEVAANITTVRLIDPTDYHVKNVAHDWQEHEKREGRYFHVEPAQAQSDMILLNDAVWIFAKGLKELGLPEDFAPPELECRKKGSWQFGRQIIEFIKARSEEAATGRIDFNAHGERNYFTLRFLELTNDGFLDLANWDPVNGLQVLSDEETSEKRVGEKLSQKTFIITSRIGAPFLLNRVPEEGEILQGNARYEGYSMDLIDAIAQLLNFKYEFRLAPDGKYGSFNKATQEWDGLVKQLLDGNADLGICDLTMTSARRTAVDFTPPFMTLGISILYAKPEVPPPNLFAFLSPFSVDVWIYMGTAYVGVVLLVFFVSRFAPEDWENPHPCKEPEELENIWTIKNTSWLAIGSIMGQGCDLLPKAASTRLVTGMWWFFALMMLNSYTANLAAFLTMSRMGESIKSADDLAAQTKIKYGAVLGGSTLGFFRDSNFSTYQRMWAAMAEARPSVFTKSNDEGVDRVIKGKGLYAFLMESTTLEYIVERKCELMQVGGWLDSKTYGIAMPFNSPYRKQISGAVLKLGESGTLSQIKRKWWKEMHGGGSCTQEESGGGDTPELGLENVGGVFLVLGLGLFSAFVIGTVEFLWNIKNVALEEKISLKDAFKAEATFALKFWINTKPVHTSSDHSSGSKSGSESTKSSRSHGSQSKHSSKSLVLSAVNSTKSLRSAEDVEKPFMSVHNKLHKISSMLSMKSQKLDQSNIATENKMEKAQQLQSDETNTDTKQRRHHHKDNAKENEKIHTKRHKLHDSMDI